MIKKLYLLAQQFLIFFILINSPYTALHAHGLGQYTYVHRADGSLEAIGMLCHRVLDASVAIASYDIDTSMFTTAYVKKGGCSETDCFVQFCFEGSLLCRTGSDRIICTPTQEFYIPSTDKWIPAYQLQAGDELFCKKGVKKIAECEYVEQTIEVYTLEVKNTHTFFVGHYGALTHNMVLPAALGMGFSVSFGSAAGSAAGSFFGPVTFIVGAAVGAVVGAVASMIMDDAVPTYNINLGNTEYIADFMRQHNNAHNSPSTASSSNKLLNTNNGGSPKNSDPKKDDENKQTIDAIWGVKKLADQLEEEARKNGWENPQMPAKDDKIIINHIFSGKDGHDPYTDARYYEMQKLVEDPTNFLGKDKDGVQWFAKVRSDGKQEWAYAYGTKVKSGGTNEIPLPFDPEFGLLKPGTPKYKQYLKRLDTQSKL